MNEIINTLIIRDIKSRFSGEPLACLWALTNPLAWIVALIIMFHMVGKQVPIHTDIINFLMPGMLSYILFRYTINSILKNKKNFETISLMYSVTSHSVFIAAALVEFINVIAVFMILSIINYLWFDKLECNDALIMIFGYLCAWGTGMVTGIFFLELVKIVPAIEKLIPLALRPVFWLSGIFYTANELPEAMESISFYNPLFQSIEIIRDGTFLSYQSRMAQYSIPLIYILGMIGITWLIKCYQQIQLNGRYVK